MAQYIFNVNQKICSCKVCPFTIGVKDSEYLNEDGSPVYHRGCVYLRVLVDLFYESRHSECPFNEVPPHGRLVDADMLKQKQKHSYKEFFENVVSVFDIDNAQTVLEAST